MEPNKNLFFLVNLSIFLLEIGLEINPSLFFFGGGVVRKNCWILNNHFWSGEGKKN